jgi:hypothetical protein
VSPELVVEMMRLKLPLCALIDAVNAILLNES